MNSLCLSSTLDSSSSSETSSSPDIPNESLDIIEQTQCPDPNSTAGNHTTLTPSRVNINDTATKPPRQTTRKFNHIVPETSADSIRSWPPSRNNFLANNTPQFRHSAEACHHRHSRNTPPPPPPTENRISAPLKSPSLKFHRRPHSFHESAVERTPTHPRPNSSFPQNPEDDSAEKKEVVDEGDKAEVVDKYLDLGQSGSNHGALIVQKEEEETGKGSGALHFTEQSRSENKREEEDKHQHLERHQNDDGDDDKEGDHSPHDPLRAEEAEEKVENGDDLHHIGPSDSNHMALGSKKVDCRGRKKEDINKPHFLGSSCIHGSLRIEEEEEVDNRHYLEQRGRANEGENYIPNYLERLRSFHGALRGEEGDDLKAEPKADEAEEAEIEAEALSLERAVGRVEAELATQARALLSATEREERRLRVRLDRLLRHRGRRKRRRGQGDELEASLSSPSSSSVVSSRSSRSEGVERCRDELEAQKQADEVTTTVDFNTSAAAPQFEVLTQPGVLIETPEDRFRVKEKPPVPHKIVSPNSERLQAEPALGETITDHHLPSPRHHSTPRETTNVPEKSDTFEHIDSTQSEQEVEEGDVTEALIDEGNPQTHQEIQESAGNNSVGVRNRGEHGGDSELSLTTTSTKTTHKAELNRRVTKKDLTELLKQEAEELEYIREAYRSKRKAIRRIDALLSKKGDLVQTMSSASSSPSSSLSSSQALSVTVTECFSSLSQPPIRQEFVSREGSVSSSSTTSSSSTVKVSHHRRKIETGSRLFPLFETPSSTQSKEASSKRVAKQPDVERMYQEYIQSFDRKTGRITGSRKDSNKTKRPKSPVYEIFRRAFDEAPKTASVSSTEKLTKCPRNAPLVKYSSSKHADTVSTATTSSSGKPYYVILEVKCPHHHHHNKHRHDRNRSSSAHQHHHHHKKEDEFHVVRCEKSSINSVSEKSSSSGVKLLHQPSKQKVKKSHRSSAEQSSPLSSSYRQHHHRQKQGSSTEDLFFNSNDVTEVRVNRGGCSWIECPPRKPSPQKASSHHPHRRRPDVSSKDTDMVAQFASEWRPAFRDYGQDPFVRNNVTRTNPPYGCDLAPNSNQHNDSSIQLSSQSLQEAFRRRMQAFIARSEARQRLIRLNAHERRLKAEATSARFANYFRQLSWHPQGSTSFQSTGNRKSVSWARNVRDHGILKPRKGSTITKRLVPLSTKTR